MSSNTATEDWRLFSASVSWVSTLTSWRVVECSLRKPNCYCRMKPSNRGAYRLCRCRSNAFEMTGNRDIGRWFSVSRPIRSLRGLGIMAIFARFHRLGKWHKTGHNNNYKCHVLQKSHNLKHTQLSVSKRKQKILATTIITFIANDKDYKTSATLRCQPKGTCCHNNKFVRITK